MWYWSKVFLKGVLLDGLGAISRGLEPTAVPPIRSSFSSLRPWLRFFWIRQSTTPRTPSTMAPPTPTTTPMTTFLLLSDRPPPPEDESLLLSAREASAVGVEVVLISVCRGVPLMVTSEVIVETTGVAVVWVVDSEEVVLLSSEEVVLEAPAVVDDATESVVVVEGAAAVVVESTDVVESAEVVGEADVVESSDVVESAEVVAAAELEASAEEPPEPAVVVAPVRSPTALERSPPTATDWAAAEVSSKAWTKTEMLTRRMMGETDGGQVESLFRGLTV